MTKPRSIPPREIPIVVFEDDRVVDLGPIVDTRPAFELRVGALNLRERIQAIASPGFAVTAVVRPHLAGFLDTVDLVEAAIKGEALLVNAQVDASMPELDSLIGALQGTPGAVVRREGRLVAARADLGDLSRLLAAREDASDVETSVGLLLRPWEIVVRNDDRLADDFAWLKDHELGRRRIFGVEFESSSGRRRLLEESTGRHHSPNPAEDSWEGATLIVPGNILVGEGVRVRPGAVIDAEAGPVILSDGVVVHPLSVVTGPAYLGPGTVVNPGAKIREGSSIGAHCKVGGEIEETVMLDLSNKQHDGFLGHAVVGSWVNLGADTNGSDLKNNYGPVRVDLGRGAVDTGQKFVGQHLADHVKTGIDTMMTTGGVVGVAANVFGGGFVPRLVPAFSWGGPDGLTEYRFDQALATARAVFARRDARFEERHERLLRHVFDATADQRVALG